MVNRTSPVIRPTAVKFIKDNVVRLQFPKFVLVKQAKFLICHHGCMEKHICMPSMMFQLIEDMRRWCEIQKRVIRPAFYKSQRNKTLPSSSRLDNRSTACILEGLLQVVECSLVMWVKFNLRHLFPPFHQSNPQKNHCFRFPQYRLPPLIR